jgi:hypothetical protein
VARASAQATAVVALAIGGRVAVAAEARSREARGPP